MNFTEYTIDVNFELITSEDMVSMIQDWFYMHRVYIGRNCIGMRNKSIYIDRDKGEYNGIISLIELWPEISLSDDSYLYILSKESKTLTLIENNKLEVISMYRPKAIEIICDHFDVEDGEDLINNMTLLWKDEEEKKEEIVSKIKYKISNNLYMQEKRDAEFEEAMRLNEDFLAEYGHMLD